MYRYITSHLPADGSNNISLRAIHSNNSHLAVHSTLPSLPNTTEAFRRHHYPNDTTEDDDTQSTEYPTEDALTDDDDLYETGALPDVTGGLQVFFGNVSTYVDNLPVRTFVCDSYVKRVVFIKTHKTASTTIASIFERFSYQRELAFALPISGHIFPSQKLFNREQVASMPGFGRTNRDILTNHARLNRNEMNYVVPGATFITIIREPVAQFESQFGYFEMAKSLHLSRARNPIEQFFKYPRAYFHRNVRQWTQNRNGQIYDLGLEHEFHDMESLVLERIQHLDKELDFVLITEFLDESLVVLRKQLCWNFTDIVYISKGIRRQSHRYRVMPSLASKIRHWNHADVLLYEHFNKTLWTKIEEYGPDFERDLEYFHELLNRTYDACVDQKRRNNKDARVSKFVLRPEASSFCGDVLRGDVSYTGLIRSTMKHMYGFDEPPHDEKYRHRDKYSLANRARYRGYRNIGRRHRDELVGRNIRPPIRRGPLLQRMIGVQKPD